MKMLKLTSLILSAIALSACGGGGSGGGSDKPATKPESINKPVADKNVNKSENNAVKKPTSSEQSKPLDKPAEQQPSKPAEPAKKAEVPKKSESTPKVDEAKSNPKVDVPKQSVDTSGVKAPNATANTPSITGNKVQDNLIHELRVLPKGEIKDEDLGYGTVTGYNNHHSFNGIWKEKKNKSELTELIVGATKLPLKALKLGGLAGVALEKSIESVFNAVGGVNEEKKAFYFGNETPTSIVSSMKGKAIYKGNAIRYDNVTSELSNVGKSTFDVDFDNKKIKGELAMKGLRRNISLKETDIKGNGFNGKAVAGENSVFITREGNYEGKFFGPKAEELSGKATFEWNTLIGKVSDLNTSFSADKQDK